MALCRYSVVGNVLGFHPRVVGSNPTTRSKFREETEMGIEYIVGFIFLVIAGWAGWSGYDRENKKWDFKKAVVALSATIAAVIAALTTVQQWLSMLPVGQ